MDLGVADRVYVVTGGARGLGRAAVDVLVAEGAQVVVSGRSLLSLAAAAADLGDAVVTVAVDNADVTAPAQLIAAARTRWGRLDGALVSVGGPPRGAVSETTDLQWTEAFGSVFLGAVRLCREIGAELPEGGALGLVLSTSVRSPLPAMAISNGLRPGLAMVAKQLADELGPRGVRVNGLLPGRVLTQRITELDEASGDPDGARETAVATIPLGREGLPEEFGRVAAFLLSPAASYVTGAMLAVDGGITRAL